MLPGNHPPPPPSPDSSAGPAKDKDSAIAMKVSNKKKKKKKKATDDGVEAGEDTDEGDMESREVDYMSDSSSSSELEFLVIRAHPQVLCHLSISKIPWNY